MLYVASRTGALVRVFGFLALACAARGQGPTEEDAVRAAHFAPHVVYQEAVDATRMGLVAVQVASQIYGSPPLVTTGTVTWDGFRLTYLPNPPDRLVVSLPDGDRDFWFYGIEGSPTDVDTFLSRDHSLDFQVARAGVLDLRLTSSSLMGVREVTAAGTIEHDGTTYSIDLRNQGTYSAESDTSGGTVRDDNVWTGTVTAPNFTLTVNEGWSFFLIRVGGRIDTTDERVINDVLVYQGSVYQWAGVRMRKSFRNGVPSQIDTYWQGTGTIIRDGAVFGEYRLSVPVLIGPDGRPITGQLRFVLALPGGETTLQSWLVQ